MPGPVLLQGGGELREDCAGMDAALLELVPGPVAVLPLASAPGRDYSRTSARARSYYQGLGAHVLDLPEPLASHADSALEAALGTASVIVLPGGSPSRLRAALASTGLGKVLVAHHERGGALSGASAGAMLLCGWTVLPEEGPRLARGLGVVPEAVVIPHWAGARDDWLRVIDRGVPLALPEASGVLIDDGGLIALGRGSSHLPLTGAILRVGARIPLPWVG